MSQKELSRLDLVQSILNKQTTQVEAALLLGITDRQVRRLISRYKAKGPIGLVSRKRGQVSKRKIPQSEIYRIASIIKQQYPDFGATLAHEKLVELHDVKISVETVRKIMHEQGIKQAKSRKNKPAHQSRMRRARFGELIQIDGSPHDWFEGRAASCCLIVFIDDATSACVGMRFYPTETTQAYMEVARWHIEHYGLPASFYSDKHSIFKSTKEHGKDTQFGRAMRELGIQTICAETPQAKGRVERSNQTLQDRLVKEMRLRGISSIEEANTFLENEYIEMYNSKFAKPPKEAQIAHRECSFGADELDLILCKKYTRKATKSLEISFKGKKIQLDRTRHRLKGNQITICESLDDEALTLVHEGEVLIFKIIDNKPKAIEVVNDKTLNQQVDKAVKCNHSNKTYRPASNHPWVIRSKAQTMAKNVKHKPSKQDVRDMIKNHEIKDYSESA